MRKKVVQYVGTPNVQPEIYTLHVYPEQIIGFRRAAYYGVRRIDFENEETARAENKWNKNERLRPHGNPSHQTPPKNSTFPCCIKERRIGFFNEQRRTYNKGRCGARQINAQST